MPGYDRCADPPIDRWGPDRCSRCLTRSSPARVCWPVVALVVAIVALVVALAAATRRHGRRPDAVHGRRPHPRPAARVPDAATRWRRPTSCSPRVPGSGPWRRAARHAVQRVGLVRYNPFEDTGGNQSFALALLDADANGVVLTSLHSRQATRVYLRTIVAGRCDAALSAEEAEALRQAGCRSAADPSSSCRGRATVGGTTAAEHRGMIAERPASRWLIHAGGSARPRPARRSRCRRCRHCCVASTATSAAP